MILYIARHGESEGNTGKDKGSDPCLTAFGVKQAQLLGKRMEKIRLDCILSSPLVRAVGTAKETAKYQHKEIEIIESLAEVENGETPEHAYRRAEEIIRKIKSRFTEDERIIIFAHGTFNNYLINAAIGFPVRDDFNFCRENTGLTCIKFLKDGKVKMEFSNDYCHLAELGGIEY